MRPIIQEETQDTILTKDITEQHIVVAVNNGIPLLLSKGYSEGMKDLTFYNLTYDFTFGNGWDFGGNCDTIQKMVEQALSVGYKVAVFHQSDWKQALQWLIDNA